LTCYYRTFSNVIHNANLQLHCFLLDLERTAKASTDGRLPPIVFYQIDGGSENTSKLIIAMCELLVARGVCQKIVLTRLPVGHTHEDIDAKFGVLWKFMRLRHVLTPQQYATDIQDAFPGMKVYVEDIFAVPDYNLLMRKHMLHFSGFAKKRKTQHQFIFDSVSPNELNFPHGVKITYRKYSQDEVYEIEKVNNISLTNYTLCFYNNVVHSLQTQRLAFKM